MRLSATLSVSCVLTLILSFALPGLAGQPPPCIKAASSKNGNFLVLMNMQLDPAQSKDGVTMRIGFSFEIFPKENFINAKDRLTAPGTYFSGVSWAQWGVALDSRNATDGPFTSFCPLPLVTDDGEFLILLVQTPAFSADEVVLRIYRWDRTSRGIPGDGRQIEELPLKKFYFPILESPGFNDGSPSWFAGGSWNFSSDNGQLIYKSQYGNTVRITLANGSISSQ
jgi:hypothetical protein